MPTYLTPGVYVEEIRDHPGSIEGVRTSTVQLVEASLSSFAAVDDASRGQIGEAMVRIVTAVMTSSPRDGDRDTPGPADIVLGAVGFPGFVASLVQGTFAAIVDASIEQMRAYAELLAGVARSVDEFTDDTASEAEARDLLVRALLAGVTAASLCERR